MNEQETELSLLALRALSDSRAHSKHCEPLELLRTGVFRHSAELSIGMPL